MQTGLCDMVDRVMQSAPARWRVGVLYAPFPSPTAPLACRTGAKHSAEADLIRRHPAFETLAVLEHRRRCHDDLVLLAHGHVARDGQIDADFGSVERSKVFTAFGALLPR